MAEMHKVTAVTYKGEKPNPHGGVLHKFVVSLLPESSDGDARHDVYWQRKSRDLALGDEFFGDIEDGEFGLRFRTAQKPDGSGNQGSSGGTFNASRYERVPDNSDRSRRIERQHSQEMGIRAVALLYKNLNKPAPKPDELRAAIQEWTVFFQQDLDADVGGGNGTDAPLVPAADVSAEASPQLKGKATQLLNKAGLAEGARKAVIMFRCGTLKAPPKDRLLSLVRDLEQGATHDTLLAEIRDAVRAGNNPLAATAAEMIPPSVPLAEDPNEKAQKYEDESQVPF